MTTASGYRRISHDQSHLLRHFHYLNQFRTYLVAVCPVSCCWPKSQSIFNPCNPLFFTTDDGKQYHCQNIVLLNNKTKGLAKIVRYNEVSLYNIFYYYWGKENRSLNRRLRYIQVRYIEVLHSHCIQYN